LAERVAKLRARKVLEIAAGTGIVSRQLLEALPKETSLTVTDLNAPMLEYARNKSTARGRNVEWRQADAQQLPFPEETFDTVVCQFGIMFFPDKAKSCSEVFRVLAPGGRYVFSVWDSHRFNPFGRIAHQVAGRFFPADPPQFYNVPFSCHQIDPIKELLIAAGFTGINAAVISLDKEIPDIANFARAAVFGNPLIDQVRTRGGVEPELIVDALTQEFRGEFGADPGRMPLQAIVFSATKR